MPELPEVETVRRGLNQVTLHQEIQGGDVLLSRTVAYPDSAMEFLSGLEGATIAQWHRRGKYLLAELVRKQESGVRGQGSELIHNSKFVIQNSELTHPSSPSPILIPHSRWLAWCTSPHDGSTFVAKSVGTAAKTY